ncbi:MAG: hypothetical protein WCF17_14085 [Terracidiphilus sp.]
MPSIPQRVQTDEVGLCAFRLLQKMLKDRQRHDVAVGIEMQLKPVELIGQARPSDSNMAMPVAYS